MKQLCSLTYTILAVVLTLETSAVAADPPLKAPAGWTGETIKLPPGFAADMMFKGVEHIRFAPGMFKPDSDSFFSYAFVFEVEAAAKIDQKALQDEFLKYYRGLCKAVGGKRLPNLDTDKFTCKLTVAQNPNNDDKQSFTGTLSWIEPFQTLKPQTLNLEIDAWSAENRSFVFACVSPKKKDAEIWKQLRRIRNDYRPEAKP